MEGLLPRSHQRDCCAGAAAWVLALLLPCSRDDARCAAYRDWVGLSLVLRAPKRERSSAARTPDERRRPSLAVDPRTRASGRGLDPHPRALLDCSCTRRPSERPEASRVAAVAPGGGAGCVARRVHRSASAGVANPGGLECRGCGCLRDCRRGADLRRPRPRLIVLLPARRLAARPLAGGHPSLLRHR